MTSKPALPPAGAVSPDAQNTTGCARLTPGAGAPSVCPMGVLHLLPSGQQEPRGTWLLSECSNRNFNCGDAKTRFLITIFGNKDCFRTVSGKNVTRKGGIQVEQDVSFKTETYSESSFDFKS